MANPKLKFKMKKLIKLTCLALFISLTTTSCSKDDDSSESFSNTIQHDQEEINITSSLIEDYGADETYYNYDFTLSGSLGDVPYEFYVELLSKGTNEFKTGIFKYVSELPSDSDDLRQEGIARELVNRIQNLRKDSGFEVTDRIDVTLQKDEHIVNAVDANMSYIKSETLTTELEIIDNLNDGIEIAFDDVNTKLFIKKH